MPRGVPKSGQRADAGTRRAIHVEVQCDGCGTTVTRREKDMRTATYCTKQCYRDNARALSQRGGNGRGRPPGPDAIPYRCSDDVVRTAGLRPDGYRHVWWPDNPQANAAGRVLVHRDVMQAMLGRPLLRSESPHHLNGVRDDNRPENLELWTKSQPAGQRVEDKVAYARAILGLYGSDDEQTVYGPAAVLLS